MSGKILALGGCVVGATLLGGTFGTRGALVGAVIGLLIGIKIIWTKEQQSQ